MERVIDGVADAILFVNVLLGKFIHKASRGKKLSLDCNKPVLDVFSINSPQTFGSI